jgi:hypothetical protein
MRWTLYLLASFVMQVVAWIVTPLLPLFAVSRYGKFDNGNEMKDAYRLPLWLAWFDTPDNSICGDWNFIHANSPCSYLSKVKWLYRNSLYGFKWSILACNVLEPLNIVAKGDPHINKNNGVEGTFCASYGHSYWQYKIVKRLVGDWGIMWNFGWQLDEFYKNKQQGTALFQFSPRFVKIKNG